MSDDKNKGWKYLISDEKESYYGDDGSWGYKNEDGSASFQGADGSWGYINEDGSGSYYGADGSWGTIYSDGSHSFFNANGSSNFDDGDDDNENSSADSNNDYSFGSAVIGLGLLGILAAIVGRRNRRHDSSDDDDRSEESSDDTDDRIYKQREKLRRDTVKQKRQEKARIRKEKIRAFRRKHWTGILLTIWMFGATLFGAYKYWEYSKLIPVGVSAESLLNTDYESVVEILQDAGFTNVHTSSLYDLDYESKDDDSLVELVLISGTKSFKAEDKYPYDIRIDIKYHSMSRAVIPVSAKKAKGKQYQDIIKHFEDAGFGDIALKVDYDLVTGWIHSAGEIESISINGDSSFEEGCQFAVDSKIQIVYHDFKKNNPNK